MTLAFRRLALVVGLLNLWMIGAACGAGRALTPPQIAYDDGRQLYLRDLTRGVTVQLTDGVFARTLPVWAPGGDALFYWSFDRHGPGVFYNALYSMQAAPARRLTPADHYPEKFSPAPGGGALAYTAVDGLARNGTNLFVIDIATPQADPVHRATVQFGSGFAWDAHTARIYHVTPAGTVAHVGASGAASPVTVAAGGEARSVEGLSADNRWLVYRDRTTNTRYRVDLLGSGNRDVFGETYNGHDLLNPTFCPDARCVMLWYRSREGGRLQTTLVTLSLERPDATADVQTVIGDLFNPAWRP